MSSVVDERRETGEPPSMDGRIAARRRSVREAGARRRLRWLLVMFGLAGGGALIAWLLFQSPFLAISEIVVSGEQRSDAVSIVDRSGVVEGIPTVRVRPAELERALAADPWIAAASVTVRWPGTVEVVIVEHAPAAWVRGVDAWLLAAAGGAVLDRADVIAEDAPRVDLEPSPEVPGETIDRLEVVAALTFLERLPADLLAGAVVSGEPGSLRASVAGFVVELGFPSDMAAKAAALATLLEADLVPSGATVSVVSPERPAVLARPEAAGEPPADDGDGTGDGDPTDDEGPTNDG